MSSKNVLLLSNAPRIVPRVMLQIISLGKIGVRTTVLCWQRENIISMKNNANCHLENVYIRAPKGKGSIVLCIPILWMIMFRKALRYSFNVVHCTHLGLLPVAILLSKIRKAKIVYDDFDFDALRITEILPFATKFIGKMLAKGIEKCLIRFVDHIFVIDTERDSLWRHYRQYTHNVTSLANYPPIATKDSPNSIKTSNAHGNEVYSRKKLIYVGGIDSSKGSLVMLQALNLVRKVFTGVKLIIVGDFSTQAEKELFMHITEKYGLSSNVEVLKWLPYNEMISHICSSQIGLAFYQPIKRYRLSRGNARKIYTYMSCGVPVIGPIFGGIGNILIKENCGIVVDTTDFRKVAKKILWLFSHPKEVKSMGRNGFNAINKRYNWENESKKFIEAYKTLML